MPFRFTLLGDGGSDAALKPILEWVLRSVPGIAQAGFALEFTTGTQGSSVHAALAGRMDVAMRYYPCDLLFVHRDAEREPVEVRLEEIGRAAEELDIARPVPIVPVRMTEAWLLVDERALRLAADNPNGAVQLNIPAVRKLEEEPDPKQLCNELLTRASEKAGRRRKQFCRPSELAWRRVRLAQLIDDFSPLRELVAFRRFYDATVAACAELE
jgi:hypothetical protein